MIKFVILLIIPSVVSPFSSPKEYNITYLNTHSGLYFFHLGDALNTNSKFTLFANINISNLPEMISRIRALMHISESLCTHHGTTKTYEHVIYFCQNSLKTLTIELNEILEKEETINNLTEKIDRVKRGLFDGVSYAFHWLFGIPDAGDAKFYDDSIKAMFDANKNTQILMKKQIGIVTNTIINFNQTMQTFRLNEEKLNKNIIKFNQFSEETIGAVRELQLRQLISEHLTLLGHLISVANENLDVLISSILLGKRNLLHPRIITPVHLAGELQKIILKDDLKLPFPPIISNMHKYFEIIKLDVLYSKSTIIFAIKIPLAQNLDYQLFEVLPIPVPHNTSNLYSYIYPQYSFLMISVTRTVYQQFHNLDLFRKMDNLYFCERGSLLKTSEKPSCETLLFTTKVKKIPSSCKTTTISAELEIWHSLRDNKWIFAITHPTIITLSCENSYIQDIELLSTGILEINGSCTCYTRDHILRGTTEISSQYYTRIPDYNIVLDECCNNEKTKINITPINLQPVKFDNSNLNELKFANHKLQELNKEIDKQLNAKLEIHNSAWFTNFLSLVGSIIGILILYYLFKILGIFKLVQKLFRCKEESSCCIRIYNSNVSPTAIPLRSPRPRPRLRNEEEEEETSFNNKSTRLSVNMN